MFSVKICLINLNECITDLIFFNHVLNVVIPIEFTVYNALISVYLFFYFISISVVEQVKFKGHNSADFHDAEQKVRKKFHMNYLCEFNRQKFQQYSGSYNI